MFVFVLSVVNCNVTTCAHSSKIYIEVFLLHMKLLANSSVLHCLSVHFFFPLL